MSPAVCVEPQLCPLGREDPLIVLKSGQGRSGLPAGASIAPPLSVFPSSGCVQAGLSLSDPELAGTPEQTGI